MICLDSEARHLKQRPFSGLVNKNTGVGYSPIISVLCVNVAISKTSRTFKSVFFIRCRRSDSSIFVDKWNLASATIARSFSQRPQAAIWQLRAWPRIHVQPRFQRGFRNGVTFLRVVYVGDLNMLNSAHADHRDCHWWCDERGLRSPRAAARRTHPANPKNMPTNLPGQTRRTVQISPSITHAIGINFTYARGLCLSGNCNAVWTISQGLR